MRKIKTFRWFAIILLVVLQCKPKQQSEEQPNTIAVYKENGVYKSDLHFPIEHWPTTVIVDSTNFWRPGTTPPEPPDSIPPDTIPPPVVHFDFEVRTQAELTTAAQQAKSGDKVGIHGGTYRLTVVPANSGVWFENYPNEVAIISGLNLLTVNWTPHTGNIYKASTNLPVNGFNTSTQRIGEDQLNATIFANQIFKDGEMMIEARWPNISTFADLLDRNKYKNGVDYNNGFNMYDITDPALAGITNMVGGTLVCNGWFMQETRTITAHSGNTLRWAQNIWDNGQTGRWARKRYYLTGKLGLLDSPKEFHYENGTLYFYPPANGPPSGTIEYKARNWGFDLRNKSNITIKGLHFIGCEPAYGNASSANTTLDGIRASYMNHHVRHDVVEWQGVGMSKQFGIRLIGPNSKIINSELSFSASTGVWMGESCRAENNYAHDMGYVGYWANVFTLWGTDGNQKVLHNTVARTGRSCFDWGYNYGVAPGTSKHYNVEVAYNDFSKWGMISQDVGASYGWGQVDLKDFNYHHNYIHDTGAPDASDVGLNVGIYGDQALGAGVVHHNIVFAAGAADTYHEVTNEERPHKGTWTNTNPAIKYINNSFANQAGPGNDNNPPYPRSYITYEGAPFDVQRNNIYISAIVTVAGSDIRNSIMPGTNPLFVGGDRSKIGIAYFQLQANSPAINAGVAMPPYTDGFTGSAPDAGALEYGAPIFKVGHDWGNIKPPEPPNPTHIESGDSREEKTGTWNYYANAPWMTPGMFSGQDYENTETKGATLKVPFNGTGVQWYSERRENHGIAEIKVDNGPIVTVDLYYNTTANGSYLAFEERNLTAGSHTIEIKFVGENAAAVKPAGILHDYFKIITTAPSTFNAVPYIVVLVVLVILFILWTNRKHFKRN